MSDIITLTHPTDPSITWTSGKRGKRPMWVQAILENKPELYQPKEVIEKIPVEKISFTNPHTNHVWNGYAKSYLKPKWVQEMMEGKEPTLTVKMSNDIDKAAKPNSWVLTGGYDEEAKIVTSSKVRCFVFAENEVEALLELNKVFEFKVSKLEFQTLWKPTTVDESIHHNVPGVYQGVTDGWSKRPLVA